jgi:glutamate synthase (NADPH/NADH) small chain
LHDSAVTIKNIEQSIIDKGFEEGWIVPEPPEKRTGKSVAVIGSGPAGLAAADQLNKAGHSVVVYEREDRPGGLLTYGIPNMKLDKEIVWRRVDLLKEEGIRFQLNTEIGKDVTYEQLRGQHDAVIVCTGATKQRELKLEGHELGGIHFAMDYLTANTKSMLNSNFKDGKYISAKDKNVVVIGGGDTGADCVATALRHGCKSVAQFGKHPMLPLKRPDNNPWPEQPEVFTMDYAYKEAEAKFGEDPRQYAIHTLTFHGDENGHVKELLTVRTEKEIDENEQVTLQQIPGTEKVWPVDLVFIAIGFEGPEQEVIKHIGLEQTERSNVKAEYGEYKTSVEGVFAAGDVRRGQSLIVWAINEGREAARECDRYLMHTTQLP